MKYIELLRESKVDHETLKNEIVSNNDYQIVVGKITGNWGETNPKNPIKIILNGDFECNLNSSQIKYITQLISLLELHRQVLGSLNESERKRKFEGNDSLNSHEINKKNRVNTLDSNVNNVALEDGLKNAIDIQEINEEDGKNSVHIDEHNEVVEVKNKDLRNSNEMTTNSHVLESIEPPLDKISGKKVWMYLCCLNSGSVVLSKKPSDLSNQFRALEIAGDEYVIGGGVQNLNNKVASAGSLAISGNIASKLCKICAPQESNGVIKIFLEVHEDIGTVVLNYKKIVKRHKIDIKNGDCVRISDNNGKLFEGVVIREDYLSSVSYPDFSKKSHTELQQHKLLNKLEKKLASKMRKQLSIMNVNSNYVTLKRETLDQLNKLKIFSRVCYVLEHTIDTSIVNTSLDLNSAFYIKRGIKARLFLQHFMQTLAKTYEYDLLYLNFTSLMELVDELLKDLYPDIKDDPKISVGNIAVLNKPINSPSGDPLLKIDDICTIVLDFPDNMMNELCGITVSHDVDFNVGLIANIKKGDIILVEKSSLVKYDKNKFRAECINIIMRQLLQYIQEYSQKSNVAKGLLVFLQDMEVIDNNQRARDVLGQICQYVKKSNMLLIVDKTDAMCEEAKKGESADNEVNSGIRALFGGESNTNNNTNSIIGISGVFRKPQMQTKKIKGNHLISELFLSNKFRLRDNDMQEYNEFFDGYNNNFQENNSKAILKILKGSCNCKLAHDFNISSIFPHDNISEDIIRRVIIQGYYYHHRSKTSNFMSNKNTILTQEDLNYAMSLVKYDIQALEDKKFTADEESVLQAKIDPESILVGFDDIGGLDDVKKKVLKDVAMPFKDNDYPSRSGVILYGPHGTGKTMLAKAIVKELNVPALLVDSATILSSHVGESEQFATAIFTTLNKIKPAILIIDEIDTILSSRGGDHSHRAVDRVKNIFLEELSKIERSKNKIIIIGTTNRINALDNAFNDRRATCIEVPLPNLKEREKIFELRLTYHKIKSDVIDSKRMAKLTDGYSGSDINNVCGYLLLKLRMDYLKKPIKDIDFDSYEELKSIPYLDAEDLKPFTENDFDVAIKKIRPSVTEVHTYSKKVNNNTNDLANNMYY